MKIATGTSLLVIGLNSCVALLAHRSSLHITLAPLLELTVPALLATFAGVELSQQCSSHQLRRAFGVFVIALGVFMVVNNGAAMVRR
jgi:uncharacterized membrane protein YfcA